MKHGTAKRIALTIGLIVSFAALLLFSVASGGTPFSQRESTAWAVVLWLLQVGVGYLLGEAVTDRRARDTYQPFLKSAIRRTYGLRKGLERIQVNTRKFQERLGASRTDHKIRTALWDEQVHSLRSQVAELISQADSSISDWREAGVADQEFNNLMKEEEQRERKIESLVSQVDTLRVASEQLTPEYGENPDSSQEFGTRLKVLASELEGKLDELLDRSRFTASFSRREGRLHLYSGNTEEAVRYYDRLVSENPGSWSNYIGRAQARYFNGQPERAIDDLDAALSLEPHIRDVEIIGKMREEMIQGCFQLRRRNGGKPRIFPAMLSIARGEVGEARAKLTGVTNPAVLNFIEASIELLAENYTGANAMLDRFDRQETGPNYAISFAALDALVEAQQSRTSGVRQLKGLLAANDEWDYAQSPVRSLEQGMHVRKITTVEAEDIFSILRARSKARADKVREIAHNHIRSSPCADLTG